MLVPVEGAVEPGDPAWVPRHAGGIFAPRPVVLLRLPAAHDPGQGGGVVRVVMGDSDPDHPRVEGSEKRADPLIGHSQSIPGSRVEDPGGSAGGPNHDRGSIPDVEDMDLQGGGDRSGGVGRQCRARPGEEQRAETRGAEGCESPAGSSSWTEAGGPHQGAREEHEHRGPLGEGKGGPGESVDPLEPGDEPRGPPAREVVEPFEGEQESEPSGGDQQRNRRGGDGRCEEAAGLHSPKMLHTTGRVAREATAPAESAAQYRSRSRSTRATSSAGRGQPVGPTGASQPEPRGSPVAGPQRARATGPAASTRAASRGRRAGCQAGLARGGRCRARGGRRRP